MSVLTKKTKEELFFHDIINLTHGIILFLDQKETKKELIDSSETKLLLQEVKSLQSLIQDHFNLKHKNLVQIDEYVPLESIKKIFENLRETYLKNKKIVVTFKNEAKKDELFYYPHLYRIMNNIIKNIAESSVGEISFDFKIDQAGLFLETKNQILEWSDRGRSLSEKIGLKAIEHLIKENGGTYKFYTSDNLWINQLFFPIYVPHLDKISA